MNKKCIAVKERSLARIFSKGNLRAFSLMEVIVVIIIVGVMASIALPNFTKTIERSHEQDALTQLGAIRATNVMYFARQQVYWPPVGWPLGTARADIDDAFGLNIIANGMTYTCQITATDTDFTCRAARIGATWILEVDERAAGAGNPCCVAGNACPTVGDC